MTLRHLILRGALAVVMAIALSAAAAAQQGNPAESWSAPRTAWGDPDLMGVWDFRTMTPLQRPDELTGKTVLTAEEAAAWEAERVALLDKDRRAEDGIGVQRDVANAYNEFWWDYGKELTEDNRTSLVVDPPDGRIPTMTANAETRAGTRREDRARPAWGPEDRGVAERCILGFNAGPPMNPSAYNNNVHIFQSSGYVVLLNEMVHDSRMVPMDGREHLPGHIRQWRGDSRGHWDGDTLVVETTNFTDKTSFRGSGKNMRLTERFTRVGPDGLVYEYTIDDPESFTKAWTAAIPMKRTEQPMFEYACHEGNYGMTNLLEGARAVDAAAAK